MSHDPASSNDPAPQASAFPDSIIEHFSGLGFVPFNQIIAEVTEAYLDSLDTSAPPEPKTVEAQLLATTNGIIKMQNQMVSTATEKHSLTKRLTPWQIAQVLVRLHHTVTIAPAGEHTDREYDVLSMYVASGRRAGTYTPSETDIRTTARRYDRNMTLTEYKEVESIL